MSRKLKLVLLVIGGLAILVVIVLAAFYLAVRQEPAFYRQALEIEPAVLEKASSRMIQQSTALAGAVRREGRWEALFTAEQINGWLAVDMAKNHPHTLPPALHDPRVAIDAKQITIACRFKGGGVNTVLSLTVEPFLPEPNVLALRIVRFRAGLLPAPLEQVLGRITQAARDMKLQLQWKRIGGDPVALISLSPTDGDRPVCIETLRLGEGEIYVAGASQARK